MMRRSLGLTHNKFFSLSSSHTRTQSIHAVKNNDLGWVKSDNREDVIKVLDSAERAAQRWSSSPTGFLSPSVCADCMTALNARSDDTGFVSFGGYSNAERMRLIVGHKDSLPSLGAIQMFTEAPKEDGIEIQHDIRQEREEEEGRESLVAALEVKGNFLFDPAQHGDFLGACLGTGVQRSKVGDILVQGEVGAQILVDPEMVDFFSVALTQVRTVPVKVTRIPLKSLRVREVKMEEVYTVEASLRLDSVASFGFKVSRTKMSDLVKSGDVRVNWTVEERPSVELKAGDIVSCLGKGRLQIGEVEMTKKDRFRIAIKRFV